MPSTSKSDIYTNTKQKVNNEKISFFSTTIIIFLLCFNLKSIDSYILYNTLQSNKQFFKLNAANIQPINDVNASSITNENSNIDKNSQYYYSFNNVAKLYSDNNYSSLNSDENSILATLEKLSNAQVIIIGIGGVGSWVCESLARSGVGYITLVDCDDICTSNINRQIHSITSSIGQMKIDVMKKRLEEINPNINVDLVHEFVTSENAYDLLSNLIDKKKKSFCVDAIDQKFEKAAIIAACAQLSIPIITMGSSAGRRDPTLIKTNDLIYVEQDKLLFWTRKCLRQQYSFPKGALNYEKKKRLRHWNILAVYSTEDIEKIYQSQDHDNTFSSASSFRRCDNGYYGTASFVTGTFGFVAASCLVQMITTSDNDELLVPYKPDNYNK